MTKVRGYYKCNVCGNVVYVVNGGDGDLVCCGEKMEFLSPKTANSSTEKHVPYVEEMENGYEVRVGKETAHPMKEEHHIVFVELEVDGVSHFAFLPPTGEPRALFAVEKGEKVVAREYCNLHGLWEGKLEK